MEPKRLRLVFLLWTHLFICSLSGYSQPSQRLLSGWVVDEQASVVVGATIQVKTGEGVRMATTDSQGAFHLAIPEGTITLAVMGRFLTPLEQTFTANASTTDLRFQVRYTIPPNRENLVITASTLEPTMDRRNDAIYQNTLFSRDDQLMDTLASGINAGQHEGGGKSIEVRRFGFNLDHGGQNGGLKILIDDIPQNQSTQGHGQGYLGSLKGLSPELVDDISILNGPFRAEYGDFSGLGVVQIHTKERLPNTFLLRAQGGSFDAYRSFVGWSPQSKENDSFLAWEHAFTNGPFLNPLNYVRDNVSGNYKNNRSGKQTFGLRFSAGRNNFDSSGQIPLDLVAEKKLDRFGYMDPHSGGRVRQGTAGVYYKRNFQKSDVLRADGFLTRSLFDLYSNFTFFLHDPINGDEIQQHDSRFMEGASLQYTHPGEMLGRPTMVTAGVNLYDSWVNVDLFHTKARKVIAPTEDAPQTEANAHLTNEALYFQSAIDLSRLHVDLGLRYDGFHFQSVDRISPTSPGVQYDNEIQPKINVMWTPSLRLPLSFYANYGRGISSGDARGILLHPEAPKVTRTDFYQLGTSHQIRRFALATDVFLIDMAHTGVYVPDDGTFEFQGPSRAYGWEAKTSLQVLHPLSLNASITQVSNSFYRGTAPREYVEAAPHTVANAGLTLAGWQGIYSSLTYRHISRYRLDPADDTIKASGLDVLDLSVSKKLKYGVEANFAIDNLNNKRYYETQNYFESQLSPDPSTRGSRIHATPGYPVGFTAGLTWRWE